MAQKPPPPPVALHVEHPGPAEFRDPLVRRELQRYRSAGRDTEHMHGPVEAAEDRVGVPGGDVGHGDVCGQVSGSGDGVDVELPGERPQHPNLEAALHPGRVGVGGAEPPEIHQRGARTPSEVGKVMVQEAFDELRAKGR